MRRVASFNNESYYFVDKNRNISYDTKMYHNKIRCQVGTYKIFVQKYLR